MNRFRLLRTLPQSSQLPGARRSGNVLSLRRSASVAAKSPVRVEDYGATVYCPSCGTEIRVGRSLQGAKFPVARQLDEKDVAGNGSAVVRRPVGKRIGLRRSLVAALVAVLASVAIAWLTGSFRGNTDRSSNGRTIVTRRSTLQETPTESPGNVAASTHSDSEQPKVVSRITQAIDRPVAEDRRPGSCSRSGTAMAGNTSRSTGFPKGPQVDSLA